MSNNFIQHGSDRGNYLRSLERVLRLSRQETITPFVIPIHMIHDQAKGSKGTESIQNQKPIDSSKGPGPPSAWTFH